MCSSFSIVISPSGPPELKQNTVPPPTRFPRTSGNSGTDKANMPQGSHNSSNSRKNYHPSSLPPSPARKASYRPCEYVSEHIWWVDRLVLLVTLKSAHPSGAW